MRTPGEICLVENVVKYIRLFNESGQDIPELLNIGASSSLAIENQLAQAGVPFVVDRIDIADCTAAHSSVRNCMRGSVESMTAVQSEKYQLAFANYVLEHVADLASAANEIYRCVRSTGAFITSIPNVQAPELMISRITPLWFHKLVRRGEAWETHYAYASVDEFIGHFERAGFRTKAVNYFAGTAPYLYKYRVLGSLAKLYDKAVDRQGIKKCMSNVCLVLEKK